jgi:hypothetical protein
MPRSPAVTPIPCDKGLGPRPESIPGGARVVERAGGRSRIRTCDFHRGRVGLSSLVRYGRALAERAGLPQGFRPNHGPRHAFASHLASSGEVDLFVIQRLLTHKTPKMAQRYAHLRDEALRRGAEVVGRLGTAAVLEKENAALPGAPSQTNVRDPGRPPSE